MRGPAPEHAIQVSPRLTAILNAGFVRFRPVRTPSHSPHPRPRKQHEPTQARHPRRSQTGPGHPCPVDPFRWFRQRAVQRHPQAPPAAARGAGSGCCAACGRSSRSSCSAWPPWASPTRAPTSPTPTSSRPRRRRSSTTATARPSWRGSPTRRATASRCRCRRCPTTCRRRCSRPRTRTSTRTTASPRRGIARAVLVAVKGGQATQGGSTITQQYVKNYFLTADRTLSRKAREILISLKIDKQQSKDQILENYLNTIYYGRGAYGIQTASKAYFNKDVSKLTPAESAFLASVIRGPSLLRPGAGCRAGGQRQGALRLHPRRDGGEGLADPGRARRRHLPGVPEVQAAHPERPQRLPHPDGQERGRHQVQDPPVRARPRGLPDRLDGRQGQAVRHGQGGAGRAAREDPVGARRHGLDQARQRRHRRALRRRGLQQAPAERRHPGQDAGRLDLQDLHPHRGPAVR